MGAMPSSVRLSGVSDLFSQWLRFRWLLPGDRSSRDCWGPQGQVIDSLPQFSDGFRCVPDPAGANLFQLATQMAIVSPRDAMLFCVLRVAHECLKTRE